MKKKQKFSKGIFTFRKLFALILIAPLLINQPAQAQTLSESKLEKAPQITEAKVDKRAAVIQAYLSKYDSPMQYQAQDFLDATDTYGLDWKLLVAIAGTESTFGKFTPGGFNAWGWGVYGDQAIYFNSWRQGIFTVAKGLKENYITKGLTDPALINSIYSTSPAWGSHVNWFLNDIANFEREYNKDDLSQNLEPDIEPQIAGPSGKLALK